MRIESRNRACRGSATIVALVAMLGIGGLAAVVLSASVRSSGEISARAERSRAFYAAESGITHALANLRAKEAGDVGAPDATVAFGGGSYWVDVTDHGDDTYTLTAYGRAGLERCGVEVEALHVPAGIFYNGVFAGNASGDPDYALELGGTGPEADLVHGDVYSGGGVEIDGDATVEGTIRATGTIQGQQGKSGIRQPIPDFAGMNYPVTSDVLVAPSFAAATYQKDDAGGSAWQLPESDPSHIFRKNPSDRMGEIASTKKDDFFLEDPYEPLETDPLQNGSAPYRISLSGVGGASGPSGNRKVYYVDGNLWLHNEKAYSFEFAGGDSSGIQVTFVVSGNIYFSDNLYYENAKKDGLAFIALEDPEVKDSGNIYWGDPRFGTLVSMSAFMYAEDDFHDNNLGAKGSSDVHVLGNMTAGDQVIVRRDYASGANPHHTKLTVDFDPRIANGELVMPGLPTVKLGQEDFQVLTWREVTPQ